MFIFMFSYCIFSALVNAVCGSPQFTVFGYLMGQKIITHRANNFHVLPCV